MRDVTEQQIQMKNKLYSKPYLSRSYRSGSVDLLELVVMCKCKDAVRSKIQIVNKINSGEKNGCLGAGVLLLGLDCTFTKNVIVLHR